MYIAIDGNEANEKLRVGVHQYAYELLKAISLININKKEEDKDDFIIYLKNNPAKDLPEENNHLKYKVIKGKSLWILRKLMFELFKNKKLNVFFSPTHYLPIFSRIPQICTIHDLGYLRFSEQFKKYDYWQLKYWSAISIYISKYIIAVSKSTKDDIVRQYPIASKKIEVVYHGVDNRKFNPDISDNVVRLVKNKYGIQGKYLLFLSTLKPSKNLEGLLQAFKITLNEVKDYKLVIAGKKGWMSESIFKKTKELGINDKVIFTGYVDDEDKPGLIKGSRAFLLPSFWEGFGIDIVSALNCGIPSIVGNVASMPEVIGDAGLVVDPRNIGGIAKAILSVIKLNSREYNQLSRKCMLRGKSFSWEKTAADTLKVIKKAVI